MKNLKHIFTTFGLLLSLTIEAQVSEATDTVAPQQPADTIVLQNASDSTALQPADSTALQQADTVAQLSLQRSDTSKVYERHVVTRKRAQVTTRETNANAGNFSGDEPDVADLRSINEGTMVGFGAYRMKDTYLSPMAYQGYGYRYMSERMRFISSDYKYSRQNIVNVDLSSTLNGAENANFLSAFVDYSFGYHYRFLPDPFLKILVGGSARGMFGMVYNTRNGNNPMTIHGDIDLNLSVIGIYEFRVKNYPFAVRYQLESPFAGALFSPVYNQSYYEIFSLGNTAEIFKLASIGNKFAMRNYLTLDFPVSNMTLRVGYFGMLYTTYINNLDRYIISNNVMLGFVKEYIAFGGREMRRRNLFNSAYY